ncbi:hypothetical protein Y1Q_0018704 [Alligator mississippiensis]|uniref:Uncharacterized protein n=1 Tax=Alligator mississippiensis TaxID=8496 RepID=A0A151NSH0_ALLMI|nr:hypothetical protein Y1Q_0018704 [Alligator mississippiensis]
MGIDYSSTYQNGRVRTQSERRVSALLQQNLQTLPGGGVGAPTVLTDVPASDPIMQQEVLGPILPGLTVSFKTADQLEKL